MLSVVGVVDVVDVVVEGVSVVVCTVFCCCWLCESIECVQVCQIECQAKNSGKKTRLKKIFRHY